MRRQRPTKDIFLRTRSRTGNVTAETFFPVATWGIAARKILQALSQFILIDSVWKWRFLTLSWLAKDYVIYRSMMGNNTTVTVFTHQWTRLKLFFGLMTDLTEMNPLSTGTLGVLAPTTVTTNCATHHHSHATVPSRNSSWSDKIPKTPSASRVSIPIDIELNKSGGVGPLKTDPWSIVCRKNPRCAWNSIPPSGLQGP